MPYLIIETSTERGIIAFGSSEDILFEEELPFGLNQSKFLLPRLTELLKPFGPFPKIDAIGAGVGPGSYTGIRIGVAVAQALAYSWNVPLIGISSLHGFAPETFSTFAAVSDARIGGLYFQKGTRSPTGVKYEGEPGVCTLEEAGLHLNETTHLISPSLQLLKAKLARAHPDKNWEWEERGPSAFLLLKSLEKKVILGEAVTPPDSLDLLYLRKTEAEREKMDNWTGDNPPV